MCDTLARQGRWDEALEILDEVLGLDLPPLGRFGPLVIRAHIAVARGDDETAERMLDVLDKTCRALGAALVLTTHDARVTARYDRRWRIADGALETGERS